MRIAHNVKHYLHIFFRFMKINPDADSTTYSAEPKSEGVVWVFHDVTYLEDRVRRQYQGQSQGVSLRVMQGVYYRVGAFKGEPVFSTERVLVDRGSLVVTTKHLYFAGPAKSLRVPYSKIVAFDQFSDGIGVTRDAQTAKPQIFVTGDGWFTCNLIQNLAQL